MGWFNLFFFIPFSTLTEPLVTQNKLNWGASMFERLIWNSLRNTLVSGQRFFSLLFWWNENKTKNPKAILIWAKSLWVGWWWWWRWRGVMQGGKLWKAIISKNPIWNVRCNKHTLTHHHINTVSLIYIQKH